MATKYEIIISAIDKGVKAAFTGVQSAAAQTGKAMTAFNSAMSGGGKAASALTNQIKALVGAYAGLRGITSVADIMQQADQAAFNMASSLDAANREFENIGSVSEWEETVGRLSDRMKVYSETSLKNAISRTVDMTKRLGLEKSQMEELIARSGDLGAGKVDLEGAIERVSAAMRGEAESAEYLGLTLNENYIKAWYEANAATEKAWKDLSDVEKAQVRYQVFLEQSEGMLGRASESAKTFAGAWQLVKTEIVDAIAKNEEVVATMNQVANSLRENAGEIGSFISMVVSVTARIIQWVVEWKYLVAALMGATVVYKVVSTLVDVFRGFNAALLVTTKTNFIGWLKKGFDGVKSLVGVISAAGAVSLVWIAGFAAIALGIGLIIKYFLQMRDAQKQADEAAAKTQASIDSVKKKYEELKDVKLPGDITALAQEDLVEFQKQLYGARAYYQVLMIELEKKSKDRSIFGGMTDEAKAASDQMVTVKSRLGEINADIDRLEAQTGFEKPKEAIMATSAELEKFKETAKKAYESAQNDAKDYADKISKLNNDIADRDISLQDKIREMRREGMSEEAAASDLRTQAIEKEQAAVDALQKFKETGNERDLDMLKRFSSEAESAWTSYANQGGEATQTAIAGLTRINETLDEADTVQIDTFSKMKEDAENAMADIQRAIDGLNANAELNIPVELQNLENVRDQINELIKDETKHITIKVSEERGVGGRVGMASGGRFPGDSTRDSIPVLARPGEGFVRNEALEVWDRKFGRGFFEGINAPWSGAGQAIIKALSGQIRIPAMASARPSFAFASGGRVSGFPDVKDMGMVKINVGDTAYPVMARQDVITELKTALFREQSRRSR